MCGEGGVHPLTLKRHTHPADVRGGQVFRQSLGHFQPYKAGQAHGRAGGHHATPANHRVHHGTEPHYLDKHYGQVLILWDRLLGTWQREIEEPTYGLVRQLEGYSIWDFQTSGAQWLIAKMRSAPGVRDKLLYLVKPPGWSHEGRHETTEVIVAGRSRGGARGRLT
jgi:hypothetical protein